MSIATVSVYVCKMNKRVKKGYEFRVSIVEKGTRNEQFFHASTFPGLLQKVRIYVLQNKNLNFESPKNGKRIKRASFKTTGNNCNAIRKANIFKFKNLFKFPGEMLAA